MILGVDLVHKHTTDPTHRIHTLWCDVGKLDGPGKECRDFWDSRKAQIIIEDCKSASERMERRWLVHEERDDL